MNTASIRWADGTYDAKRTCDECGKVNCKYPVHNDYYKEISSKKAKAFDAQTEIDVSLQK